MIHPGYREYLTIKAAKDWQQAYDNKGLKLTFAIKSVSQYFQLKNKRQFIEGKTAIKYG